MGEEMGVGKVENLLKKIYFTQFSSTYGGI